MPLKITMQKFKLLWPVRDDTGSGAAANPRKRNDFELAVACILQSDPITRKRSTGKQRGGAETSTVGGKDVDSEEKNFR